ncbi:MAG: SGNH/GDSL hydrolase family protein [Acidimicrobiales bacterium]
MFRRVIRFLSPLAVLAAAVTLGAPGATADPGAIADPGGPPDSMAALGDSITRAFNACGWYYECTERSWSTGDDGAVQSHYLRILAVNPDISGQAYNDAVSGAQADALVGQANLAVDQGVEYVTIEMGGNDACTSSEATMTSVETYRAEVDAALDVLQDGLPEARVFIASVPNVYRLWEVGRGDWWIRFVWDSFDVCQSVFANAGSTNPADEARRQRVRQRVVDYNTQLAEACAAYGPNCDFDDNAVFNFRFERSHVSGWDYFHPNGEGQRRLAEISYAAGFGW